MPCMVGAAPVSSMLDPLPGWVTLTRAPNPGVMTLDGTNTWVLGAPDAEDRVVIDPGPADEGHLARIVAQGPVAFILITHGHPDHVEGAARLAALLGDAAVLAVDPAHGVDAAPLDRGASLVGGGLAIDVLDTPGHTADSVCFRVAYGDEQVIFTGDTLLGRGSTVVAWPDGDLGAYLRSLETLSSYRGVPMLPGHGPALADCAAVARAYLAHRRTRLAQVRAALAAGDRTPADVVARVYADVDRSLWPAAEWSVRAQLAYLRTETEESAAAEINPVPDGLEPM